MTNFCDKSAGEYFVESIPLILGTVFGLAISQIATSFNNDCLLPVIKGGVGAYEHKMFVVLKNGKKNYYHTIEETIDDAECIAVRYASLVTDLIMFVVLVFLVLAMTRLLCFVYRKKKRSMAIASGKPYLFD